MDKAEPRKHSVALDLKDVERFEFYVCALNEKHGDGGFLLMLYWMLTLY